MGALHSATQPPGKQLPRFAEPPIVTKTSEMQHGPSASELRSQATTRTIPSEQVNNPDSSVGDEGPKG